MRYNGLFSVCLNLVFTQSDILIFLYLNESSSLFLFIEVGNIVFISILFCALYHPVLLFSFALPCFGAEFPSLINSKICCYFFLG